LIRRALARRQMAGTRLVMRMEFSDTLRALMEERGISGCELARRVHCDRSLIYKFRNGKQQPSTRLAQRCDEALGAGGSLVALVPKNRPARRTVLAGVVAGLAGPSVFGTLDPEGRDRLAWAQRQPRRIDGTTVRSLTDMLAAQRHAEDALGSAALVKPVTAQLAAVEDLAAEARGPLRPAVIDIAEQWAQFAAWLNMSVRNIGAARALWRQTLELSVEAGDVTMTATALTYRAAMAGVVGKTGPMIGLAQAAQRDSRAAAGQRAHSASVEGRGHAMNGDVAVAERKLAEAADFASQPATARPWLYWCSPQIFECRRGVALGYLAHIGTYRDQAVEALTAGYAGLGADVRGSEWTADVLLHRAAIHARGGDVAQACADAVQVVPVRRQTNSVSLRDLLAQLHAGLAVRWPDDPRVTELAEALA
jgi:transcriptional regulator with XRE-family HTH domain